MNIDPDAAESMCASKHRYPRKKDAHTAMNALLHSHRRNRPDALRAYPCPCCRGWHLTKAARPKSHRNNQHRKARHESRD